VLPIICIALVLRLGHARGGACVLTWAEFQHSVVYYATDQCRKRLEACRKACRKWGGRHSLARPLAESTRHHSCSIRRNLVLIRPCLKRRFFGYEILNFFSAEGQTADLPFASGGGHGSKMPTNVRRSNIRAGMSPLPGGR